MGSQTTVIIFGLVSPTTILNFGFGSRTTALDFWLRSRTTVFNSGFGSQTTVLNFGFGSQTTVLNFGFSSRTTAATSRRSDSSNVSLVVLDKSLIESLCGVGGGGGVPTDYLVAPLGCNNLASMMARNQHCPSHTI